MEFTLTKFKYVQFASQETPCFEAVLCVNQKPQFHVRNDGNGGANYVHLVQGATYTVQEVEDYCKSLPPIMEEAYKDVFPNGMPQDLETVVFDLVDAKLREKDISRETASFKKKVQTVLVYTRDKENLEIYTSKPTKPWNELSQETKTQYDRMLKEKFPDGTLLNTLDFETALAIWLRPLTTP